MPSSSILPSLKINSEEEKIIVECSILFKPSYADYYGHKPGTAKKAFGYFLLTPKPRMKPVAGEQEWYYHSAVIFTPKPGLFDDERPQ